VLAPKVTGFVVAATESRSMTLYESAIFALNGAIGVPRVNKRPVPALKVNVPTPPPKLTMVGSVVAAGRPVVVSPGLEGVGVYVRNVTA
jgi:hypothetical protein